MKISILLPIIITCIGFSLCAPFHAFAQTATSIQKKLIEAGWDKPDTDVQVYKIQ